MIKKYFILTFSLMLILFASNQYAQTNDDDLTKLKHFKILVKTSDDSIFYKVQVEMGISNPLDTYTLIVNITSGNTDKQRIIIGLENDPSALIMNWLDISESVRNGLIAWSKPNKMPIDK